MAGSPSKCSWRIMCTWHLSPVYNRSRFLDESSAHLRCCFLFCSDLETSVKPKGRDDHTDISLRIHLLISWQMKCFVLRSLIHLFKVWMCSINSRLTSGFFLPLGPKRDFSGESSTSSRKEMSFIGQWNHTHRNRSRQFYRSPPMIPIRYPLMAWLASSQCKFKEVLSIPPEEHNVAPKCLCQRNLTIIMDTSLMRHR